MEGWWRMAITVDIMRSARRVRTLSARLVGERLEVRVPADYGEAETRQFVEKALRRLERTGERRSLNRSQNPLQRALVLSERYFEGRLVPSSVEYVGNQQHRFGSCSVRSRRIRLSDRVAAMPEWVRDYVLIHELAHLQEPNHSRAFWRLVNRYKLAERARGYLMAVGLEAPTEAAPGSEPADSDVEEGPTPPPAARVPGPPKKQG
jgi:predicted metal-dependent hydrolase